MANTAVSPLPTIRRQTHRHARAVFGWFALVWLGVAVQPCAMAFGLQDEADCVHCPAGAHGTTDAHAGHGEMPAHSHEAAPAPDCGDAPADCYVLPDTEFDNRSSKTKPKDSPQDQPLVPAPSVQRATLAAAPPPQCLRGVSRPPLASRPLHVLHCVYLD
ncbi:MAG: hypothetical protein U5K76_13880 [Woeseiaceae bacterium]|nr:hypothetical protein [Woeseiaceae bacterium]